MSGQYIPQSSDYSDIIDLPRHVSSRHVPMPLEKRAAQFSPFAALTGFESAIEKAGLLFEEEADRGDAEYIDFEDI